ncbi:hypothetical protein AVEN_232093-1 [Araneus ventricosus]|uniref:Uncharacterized protein n=1 Tax=Araneus ventricosus TaxID=182803 RepID=A0A4Y2I3V7_ARAVE|nr:hypothetical protein AVEN_232093-1 [Araneus ventricosus]
MSTPFKRASVKTSTETLRRPSRRSRAFCGIIGKAFVDCEQPPIVPFEPIQVNLPEIKRKDLSTDQQYLFRCLPAVASGQCSKKLSKREPGTLSHSSWLTTANRILPLYITTDSTSQSLFTLTEYIMKVHVPMWFTIKIHLSCKDGSKYVFGTIKKSHYLSAELKAVLDPVIQRNGYFGNPENILIAMITDNRNFIRELGLRLTTKVYNARY